MKKSLFSSIKFKLVVFVTVCVTASLIICGVYFGHKISQSLTQIQVDRLESETLIISPLFLSAFREVRSDLSVLSSTPPIQGIIRSSRNGGADPQDGSTSELWRARLAEIFSGILQTKPAYTQIRYIGIDDNGRELVRVNKNGEDIKVVQPEDLQSKGGEPYFEEGEKLSAGEVYFSAVSLNRENGKIQKPYLPMIRGVVPVHDDRGQLFGMIVINAAYESILNSVLQDLQIEKDLYVINENGDYIQYDKQGEETNFVFHSLNEEEGADNARLVRDILDAEATKGTVSEKMNGRNMVVQYFKDTQIFDNADRFLAYALLSPRDAFMAPVYKAQQEAVLIIIASVLVCLSLAVIFAMKIINPLVKMNRRIREHDGNEMLTGLPVDLKDEIGSLARSFSEAYKKVSKALQDEHVALMRLAESEEQFRNVMKYSPVGKALVSLDGQWLKVNKSLCAMLGYDENELLKTDFQTLTHPDDLETDLGQVQQMLDGTISTYKMEKRYIRKDGETIWGILSVSLLHDANGKPRHFISQIMDITDIKEAQKELEELNTELEEFSYRTSHDLRSPLRSAIGLLGLTKDSIGSGDEDKAQTSIELALGSLTKLEVLLSDILDLGSIKNFQEEPQDMDLREIVGEALAKMDHMENYNRLDVKIDIDVDEPVHTKKTRLVMIVENLISNSIKYQDTEKKKSFIKIEAHEDDAEIVFAVEDNGLGIPEDQRENMFEMFKRFHPKVSFGSGLGMYMMQKSANVIGGEIRYVDTKDGTRFELRLPKSYFHDKKELSNVA